MTGVWVTAPTMPHMVSLCVPFSSAQPLRPAWRASVPSGCNRGDPPTPSAAMAATSGPPSVKAGLVSEFCHHSVFGAVVIPANSTRITAMSRPRATPKIAPSVRSRKPSPTARTRRDSRKPRSAPTIEHADQDQGECRDIARRRRLAEVGQHAHRRPPKSGWRRRTATTHAAREMKTRTKPRTNAEYRRQANNADDHEIERGHPTWATMPLNPAALSLTSAASAASRDA